MSLLCVHYLDHTHSNEQGEPHAGYIENPLCHNKPNWKEQVGGRNKREDDEGEGLQGRGQRSKVRKNPFPFCPKW